MSTVYGQMHIAAWPEIHRLKKRHPSGPFVAWRLDVHGSVLVRVSGILT